MMTVRVLTVVLLTTTSAFAAQIDSIGNASIGTADALPLPVGSSINNLAELTLFDVDFFNFSVSSGNVAFGMATPLESVLEDSPNFSDPDTLVGVFHGATLVAGSDDDGASELVPALPGNHGSLFRARAGSDGTMNVGVTGSFDSGFSGIHASTGSYLLTIGHVDPTVVGGDFGDSAGNDMLAGADPIGLFTGSAVAVATLAAGGGDVDMFKLNLVADQILTVMSAPLARLIDGDGGNDNFNTPDTILSLLDSTGTPMISNDDAGDLAAFGGVGADSPSSGSQILGSAIRAIIPSDGTYYLRITGAGSQEGRYGLLVGAFPAVPEPSSTLLLAMGSLGLIGLRRRKRGHATA